MTVFSDMTTASVDVVDGIAYITLNRPAVLNAVNRAMRVELAKIFRALQADDAVSVVVIKGAGRAFCAGQDQAESASMTTADAERRIEDYSDLYRAIRHTMKPVIAQIHGYAIGAGLQIALLADMAMVGKSTRISMPELERGSACITGTGLMWPIVGAAVTKRLVLKGERISAEEAMRYGLFQEVYDDDRLEDEVKMLARTLANRPKMGMHVTKQWWNRLSEEVFEMTLTQARDAHRQTFATGSFTQAAAEFLQRKKAV